MVGVRNKVTFVKVKLGFDGIPLFVRSRKMVLFYM